MLTLHKATDLTKKILLWGGGTIAGIVIIFFLLRGGTALYKILFPKPVPPPQAAFGKLPEILFPKSSFTQQFTYVVDTVSGNLGVFPDRFTVYKTVTAIPNLLNLQRAKTAIDSTTFGADQQFVTDTVYTWRDNFRPDKTITMNIVAKDFTITSNYLTYPDLAPTGFASDITATNAVAGFLEAFGLYPLDFDQTLTTTQLLTLDGTSLFPANTPSTAQLIRVDLFQSALDKTPIVYPHPPFSSTHFLVGGLSTNELLEGTFFHQTIGTESTSYFLKSVQQAYDELTKQKAYIANYYGTSTSISIKDIYLGYYMNEQKQAYVLPVYIFEGKDGFFAYVSAISDAWIEK